MGDALARMALLVGLLSSSCAAAVDAANSPAWTRHCATSANDVRDDGDRAQRQLLAERCTAHDACTLACRASTCADRVEKSCEADCRRADPLAMARLADRWEERSCTDRVEVTADDWWDTARVDAVLAARLGNLAHEALPDGATEVRIWAYSGPVVQQPMLRLRRSARGVITGDLYIVYPANWAMDGHADGRDLRRFMRAHCKSIGIGADKAMCHARFAPTPRWHSLYRRFEALGLLTLPDQEELPRPDFDYIAATHGIGMEVEVRQGGAYRTYEYDSNGAQGRDQAKVDAAFEILVAVLRLQRNFFDER